MKEKVLQFVMCWCERACDVAMCQYLFAMWAFIVALLLSVVCIQGGFMIVDSLFGTVQPQPQPAPKAKAASKKAPAKNAKKRPAKKSKKRSK